jgi:alkanesulfonate monooxygenase SsuD/methylene tetrahydromethanopterin reductase-like flavin-dependent oxidoreductase (luciferase family)
MAHSAMTVANLSSGRFGLGIGPGPKQWVNDWHGMAFDPVMPRMREYLAALRACLQASEAHPTEVDGHYFPTHGYGGWDIVVPEPVSLHLGASQQKMTELAGELCDGVMLNNLHPLDWVAEHAEAYLKTGRARAGRPDDFDFTVEIGRFVGIHPDRATAYDLCRQQLCFYFAIPYFRTVLEPYGFGPELDAGELALRSGNRPDLVAAVSDRMVDAIAIAGTTDEVYAKLEAYSPYVDAINISGGMNIESSEAVAHLERMITVFGRS